MEQGAAVAQVRESWRVLGSEWEEMGKDQESGMKGWPFTEPKLSGWLKKGEWLHRQEEGEG